ncbi:MAG: hypothetical protein FJY95_20980 [Candidatus Handelsmanbacteria bacterium]|nr:hypothetical protein [Candidatus Handelsmanbacteria bacterium]
MANDQIYPETRECYHFQPANPVLPEGLIQLAHGTAAAIYDGGLLQVHRRYLDPARGRTGLPEHGAAQVDRVGVDHVGVTLVNADPVEARTVLLRAGTFGEHQFGEARISGADRGE